MSAILRGFNTKKTQKYESLPEEYIVSKFFELGPYPQHNRYNNTYQCSCPICREGKSFGRKQRCFYIPESELIYCHNCGWSGKPVNWIMSVSGMSFPEVMNEVRDGNYDLMDAMAFDEEKPVVKFPSLPEDCINLYDKSQILFYSKNKIVIEALKYLKKRNLLKPINKPSAFYISLKDKIHRNRIIIPFVDINNKIVFYQSRKIFDWDEKPDYLSKINADKSLFNIQNVDSSNGDTIFIFEGPIDACFVKNGVGIAGINEGFGTFTPKQEEQFSNFKFFDKIWVLDNQWIDKAAKEKTIKLLEMGHTVFLWPAKWKQYKDFNALCVDNGWNEVDQSIIKENSASGKGAIMKVAMMGGHI